MPITVCVPSVPAEGEKKTSHLSGVAPLSVQAPDGVKVPPPSENVTVPVGADEPEPATVPVQIVEVPASTVPGEHPTVVDVEMSEDDDSRAIPTSPQSMGVDEA